MSENFYYFALVEDAGYVIGLERIDASSTDISVNVNLRKIPEDVYNLIESKMGLGFRFRFTQDGDIIEERDLNVLRRLATSFMDNILNEYVTGKLYIQSDDEIIILDSHEIQLISLCVVANVKFTISRGSNFIEFRPSKVQGLLARALKRRSAILEAYSVCYDKIHSACDTHSILKQVNTVFKNVVEGELDINLGLELI